MLESVLFPIVSKINEYLSNYILIFLLVGVGLWYSIKTRFVQVRCFGEGMKKFFGEMNLRGGAQKSGMTSFQALATAIAAQVGTGNIVGSAGAILAAAHGFEDHFAADEREQRKAHVRADGRDIAGHRAAENVTRERHEKLERAEIQPVPERIARLERAHGDTVCNGHRKRIHGKGNADEYDRKHGSLRTGKEYGRRARTRA